MSLWGRVGCQTESNAFEKWIVARIVGEPIVKPIRNEMRNNRLLAV